MKRRTKFYFLFTLLIVGLINHVSISYANVESVCLPDFNPNVDGQITDIMSQYYIPSVTTAVIRNNSIIWSKGYGEQSDLDLIYLVGSVTKTFTATAIFQLYDQGLIQLDDDVNDYLPFSLRHPNFTNTPITFTMLLQHKSSLTKDSDPYWFGIMSEALQDMGWENPFDWLPYPDWIEGYLTPNGTLYEPIAWSPYEPGTNRLYSNVGYDVLGYLIQVISGEPIWEYLQNNIYDPLGMVSTGYNYTSFDLERLAIPYIYLFELDSESTGNKAYPHYNSINYGAGGIRSDIFDLAKFIQVFLHRGVSNGTRILEEETLQTMVDLQTAWLSPDDPLIQWGGWGGTEGDSWAFHTKAYGYYNGNTTVPYGVITFLNQGMDEGRDACFNITMLLAEYVHKYDVLECEAANGFIVIISISSFLILVVLRRKISIEPKYL